MKWVEANQFVTRVGLILAAAGTVVALLRLAWLCTRPLPGQAGARVIAGVWGIGTLLLLGIAIVPIWFEDVGMLLAQFLLSIEVIYPLLLVYAVRQVELLGALEREVVEKQRWADLAQELRRFREEDLRRVAHELHDTVLAELRAVELRLESLMPPGKAATTGDGSPTDLGRPASAVELQALRETVRQIGEQARRVTIGAMPLDFHTVGLREALQEAVERFRRMAPDVEARLEIGPFDAETPPAVREAAYWIVVSALNNCREHGRASQVRVSVSAEGDDLQVTVRDDGVGFDAVQVRPEGLGLRNMRARAAEVGGELQIESGPGGTTVRFRLTLVLSCVEGLPRQRPIRVLVVEDSEAFVAGLRAALARWAHEVEIVRVVESTQDALALAQTLQPESYCC